MCRLFRVVALAMAALLVGSCDSKPTDLNIPETENPLPGKGLLPARAAFPIQGAYGRLETFVDPGDGTVIFIFLGVNQNVSAQIVPLSYSVVQCGEIECTELQVGSGLIPKADLAVQGNSEALHLRTNTSAEANPGFVRSVGSGGVIAIDWAQDHRSSTMQTGTLQVQLFNTICRQNGTTTGSSASAQGSLIGIPVSTFDLFSATVGTAHLVDIQMVRTR